MSPNNYWNFSIFNPFQKLISRNSRPCSYLFTILPACTFTREFTTARAGNKAPIYHGSTPELFKINVNEVLNAVKDKPYEHKIIFLKSWNEWAEGNYVEPDLKFGHGYLDVLKETILPK